MYGSLVNWVVIILFWILCLGLGVVRCQIQMKPSTIIKKKRIYSKQWGRVVEKSKGILNCICTWKKSDGMCSL